MGSRLTVILLKIDLTKRILQIHARIGTDLSSGSVLCPELGSDERKINHKTTINVFGIWKGRKLWGQKVAHEINASILTKNLKNFKLQKLKNSTPNDYKLPTRYF